MSLCEAGAVDIDVPRDRSGYFDPVTPPEGKTRLSRFNDRIISSHARGMTVRDVQAHLEEIYGVEVSPDPISKVTDGVWDELESRRNRLLCAMYPIVYIDALNIKTCDGFVATRPAYLAAGADLEGRKHVLGIWIGDSKGEGSRFSLSVFSELRNRGVADVLIVACDGLTGADRRDRNRLTESDDPNVSRAPAVRLVEVCALHGSEEDRRVAAADLHRPVRRRRRGGDDRL